MDIKQEVYDQDENGCVNVVHDMEVSADIVLTSLSTTLRHIDKISPTEEGKLLPPDQELVVSQIYTILQYFSWPMSRTLSGRVRNVIRDVVKGAVLQGAGISHKPKHELQQLFRIEPQQMLLRNAELAALQDGEIPPDFDLSELGLYRRYNVYVRLMLCPLDPAFQYAPFLRRYIPGLSKGLDLVLGQNFREECEEILFDQIGLSKLQISWWDENMSQLRTHELRTMMRDMTTRLALILASPHNRKLEKLNTIINEEQQRKDLPSLSRPSLIRGLRSYFKSAYHTLQQVEADQPLLSAMMKRAISLPSVNDVMLSSSTSMVEVAPYVMKTIMHAENARDRRNELSNLLTSKFGPQMAQCHRFGTDSSDEQNPYQTFINFYRLRTFLYILNEEKLEVQDELKDETIEVPDMITF